MTVRAILFDADGVLQNWNAEAITTLRRVLPQPDRFREFLDDVLVAEAPCLAGQGDFVPRLQMVLDDWQVQTPAAELISLWSLIDTDAAMMALIERLRQRGTPCALATNQQHYRAATMRSRYDGLFDADFYSCELGVAKPNHGYFRVVAERLGLPAQSLLFVDDKPDNTAAAAQVGLQTLTFNARELSDPAQTFARLLADQWELDAH